MNKKCEKCGRVWYLTNQSWPERDPGEIFCHCGASLHSWNGSTTWTWERLVEGLPEDEGRQIACTYRK